MANIKLLADKQTDRRTNGQAIFFAPDLSMREHKKKNVNFCTFKVIVHNLLDAAKITKIAFDRV